MTAIKICGVTRIEDAELALDLGVEALGLNLWPGSKRCCDRALAREIAARAEGRARVVAVVVDAGPMEHLAIRRELGIEWIQLHGDEPDDELRALLPHAYRAIRATGERGFALARAALGREVLLDASVPGQRGGTGALADWDLAARVARERPLWLAGGLDPHNVAAAIAHVRPMGVDVASGVESAPGVKDPVRLRAFVHAARGQAPSSKSPNS